MKRLLVLLFVFVAVGTANAQETQIPSPTPPTTKIQWNHDGVNVDRFELVVDSVTTSLGKLTPVTGTIYVTPFPAITPGDHVLSVRACNIAGCAASAPLSVKVVVVPTQPTGLQIVVQ